MKTPPNKITPNLAADTVLKTPKLTPMMRLQTAPTAPVKVHPKLGISESLPFSNGNGILY